MARTLLGLALLLIGTVAAADDAPPVAVRVVTPDGKPAAGAKVWVYPYSGEKPAEPTPLVAGADGKLTVLGEKDAAKRSRQLFARDADGRIGHAWVPLAWEEGEAQGEMKVVLVNTADLAGRVVDPDGKPVAGATVTPLSYFAEERDERAREGKPLSISLPDWEQGRLAMKTDADGRFKFTAPAAGYSVYYKVKADGFGETQWSAPAGVELETKLTLPGSVTITATGIEPAKIKGMGVFVSVPWVQGEKPRARQSRYFTGAFDAAGKVTIEGVAPGNYYFGAHNRGAFPALFQKADPFEVTSGKATAVTAKFGRAATVTGRITDKAGKGLAKVPVNVNISDDGGPNPREFLQVETDADGNFVAHGSAGWYLVWLNSPPDGYALPAAMTRQGQLVEPAKVELGKSHAFPAIALLNTVTFSGRVVTADGKPAPGAVVDIGGWAFADRRGGKVAADKDGKFAVANLPPDESVMPRVRLGTAVNVPQTFDLEKTTGPVTIEIGEANGAGFQGQVTDAAGKPIAGAKVILRHHIMGVGRNSQYGTYGSGGSTTTDADGRYSFAGFWPRDAYGILVKADGYAEAEAKQLRGEAGEVCEFGTVKLTRANLSVGGTVVGADGKPVAGVEVFTVDGPVRTAATTAADGTFTLGGFPDTAGYLIARKDGYRVAAVPVFPARPERVTVTLAKADAPPGAQPSITAEHRAALDRFTRHALTLVWDNHATFGYGGNALIDLARIDLDAAKKWRDEMKLKTDGKTDFTRHIARATRERTLFDIAKADIDEAVATLSALAPEDGFAEAIRVGEKMLAVDRAKAARLAEEAVVKARQLQLPRNVYSLAQAGDLAVRAGSAGGKKVLAEAADMAGKLTPDERGRNSLAIGMVAARLAPHDRDTAEKLLNSLKDPGDFNRCLSNTVARVARTDPDRAVKLLGQFKPDGASYLHLARARVAFALARDKPDEALKLVESIKEGPHRALGLIGLARIYAPTHKPRAVKMIDAAFDLMERDPVVFRSWSGMGGRAAVAAIAAVRAKELGYPDVAALVARTLAMRGSRRDAWRPDEHDEQTVNLAAVLALVDPAAARHLLATIAPPDEFIAKALSQRREWLFALALADPVRATTLADRLIDRAKASRDGRNGLSATGLVELGSILTAADRLRELTGFSGLPGEIGDDD